MRDHVTLERAQRTMRSTFMASQGRSHVQVAVMDAIVRMWREDDLDVGWGAFDSEPARRRLAAFRMPGGHSRYAESDIRAQFELWWEILVRIGRYVYDRDPSVLPSHAEEERFRATYVLPIDRRAAAAIARYKDDDVAAFVAAFTWYAEHDPHATMTADEAIMARALPAFIEGDRYWVSSAGRPGSILSDRVGSLMKEQFAASVRDRAAGRRLGDLRRIYVRMNDIVDGLAHGRHGFDALPDYPLLVAEYNAGHPGAPVARLHG